MYYFLEYHVQGYMRCNDKQLLEEKICWKYVSNPETDTKKMSMIT